MLVFAVPLFFAALTASIDALQAGIWIISALLLAQGIVDPILRRYRRQSYPSGVKIK